MTIYDFKMKDIMGEEVDFNKFRDNVLLIVNTATGCGFTPQYEGLEKLYETYQKDGFEILDFPCNQFKEQAPGTDGEIHSFCKLRYDVKFTQFAKIDVNGENEAPIYSYLKKEKSGILGSKIKWNFTKFLVDKQGKVVKRYAPTTKPKDIEKDIIALLK